MMWKKIETAPEGFYSEMFVVIAIDVVINGLKYTSDPVTTWRDADGSFPRWNHDFPPTHWYELPYTSDAE